MKRVEQTNTTVYIIDEENKSVKATIKNTKYDAINSIVKAFNQSPLDASVSPAYFLNTTYSATATLLYCNDETDEENIVKCTTVGDYLLNHMTVTE